MESTVQVIIYSSIQNNLYILNTQILCLPYSFFSPFPLGKIVCLTFQWFKGWIAGMDKHANTQNLEGSM